MSLEKGLWKCSWRKSLSKFDKWKNLSIRNFFRIVLRNFKSKVWFLNFIFVFCLLHALTNFSQPIRRARFISVGWWFINTKFLRIMDEQGDVWEVKIKPRNLLKNNYGYFWLKMKWTIKMMTRKMRLRRASKGSKHFLNFLLINNLK